MRFFIQCFTDYFTGCQNGQIRKFSSKFIDRRITFGFNGLPRSFNNSISIFFSQILSLSPDLIAGLSGLSNYFLTLLTGNLNLLFYFFFSMQRLLFNCFSLFQAFLVFFWTAHPAFLISVYRHQDSQ